MGDYMRRLDAICATLSDQPQTLTELAAALGRDRHSVALDLCGNVGVCFWVTHNGTEPVYFGNRHARDKYDIARSRGSVFPGVSP